MRTTTAIRKLINSLLGPVGLEVRSTRHDRTRMDRVRGYLDRMDGSVPFPERWFLDQDRLATLIDTMQRYRREIGNLWAGSGVPADNDYFSGIDAAVLYAMIRSQRPSRILEIGCGHSTRIMRHAVDVGREATTIIAVDPQPRTGIDGVADRVIRQRMEETDLTAETDALAARDIVFVDSSHEVDTGNDVIQVLLRVVPTLAPGVLVHVHDIFLPFEYPRQWLLDFGWRWNEQYLLHALLADSPRYRVIWPGYALWRTRQELIRDLPGYDGRAPQSFWFEIAGAA